jgi:Rab3 GTPase-activating protein catalytic subunit
MSNEEVFDDEFYQEDFSTASEWEAFVSRLSDLLEGFEVVDEESLGINQLSLCEWTEENDEILFNDFDLIVTRYKAKIAPRDEQSKSTQCQVFQDLISTENDYCLLDTNYLKNDYEVLNAPKPPNIHPIAVWYGLRDFVVIKNKRKPLTDISQVKLLQSSLSLAVFDSKCKIPAFIQVLYHEQDVYLGVYEHAEQRLSFDVVHLKTPPPSCKYLSGLIEMFKGKIGMNYVNNTMVSVCLSYSLKNFLTAAYSSDKKSDNDDWDVVDFINVVSSLPFGVSVDPVNELILYTKWPQVSENVVFDSQTYSDFNPINAPKWSIRTRFDYTPVCYLADMLHEFLTLSESPEALSEYYSFLSAKTRINEQANPFASLTESRIPSLPGMSMLDSGGYTIDGPLNEQQLKKMFYYLLPDEDPESKFPYGDVKDDVVRN